MPSVDKKTRFQVGHDSDVERIVISQDRDGTPVHTHMNPAPLDLSEPDYNRARTMRVTSVQVHRLERREGCHTRGFYRVSVKTCSGDEVYYSRRRFPLGHKGEREARQLAQRVDKGTIDRFDCATWTQPSDPDPAWTITVLWSSKRVT